MTSASDKHHSSSYISARRPVCTQPERQPSILMTAYVALHVASGELLNAVAHRATAARGTAVPLWITTKRLGWAPGSRSSAAWNDRPKAWQLPGSCRT